jgi:nucleoside-diphosphate-sugar epimerase
MRIIVLGAGHVGRAIVDALYQEHEITGTDTDADRLTALADRIASTSQTLARARSSFGPRASSTSMPGASATGICPCLCGWAASRSSPSPSS